MRALFWIGLLVLVLGIASLFVPIPRNQRDRIEVGDVSLRAENWHEERLLPVFSALLIAGGIGMAVAAKVRA